MQYWQFSVGFLRKSNVEDILKISRFFNTLIKALSLRFWSSLRQNVRIPHDRRRLFCICEYFSLGDPLPSRSLALFRSDHIRQCVPVEFHTETRIAQTHIGIGGFVDVAQVPR